MSTSNTASLCTMIEHGVRKNENNTQGPEECEVHFQPQAYMNNVIVALVGILAYLIAGCLINALGNKRLMSEYCSNVTTKIPLIFGCPSSNWINIEWRNGIGIVLVNHNHDDPDTVEFVCQHRKH